MRNKLMIGMAAAALALAAATTGQAQTYSNAVMALGPAAYWPLNETTQPPMPLNITAVNLGTLGATANGSYGAWYQPLGNTWYLTNNIVQTNAITAPFDGSTAMLCQGVPGQYVTVPRTVNGVQNTNLTIVPPFSVETWVQIGNTNGILLDYVSEGGFNNVNFGGPNTNNPFYGGLGTGWAGFELGQFQDYIFFACQATNGQSKANELDTSAFNAFKGFKIGQWVHVVATFNGTTEAIYTNSVLCVSKNIGKNGAGVSYVPDPSTPLMIGGGNEPSSSYGANMKGVIEDVAIYNQVLPLTSIQNHFQAAFGTNATYGSSYTNAVLADSPIIYYRLNDAVTNVSAGYPTNTFPAANNYGSLGAAASGLYQPGTVPGVAGPPYTGFGGGSKAVAINGWLGAVDVGGSNLPAALNPTGTSPLTVVTWFQGNMADAPGRFQELLGHGNNSYRLSLGTVAGENHFNPGPATAELQFTSPADVATNGFALNDGNWHMAAGVSDGTNEYLYLDGLLAKSSNFPAGINITGSTTDLLLGGDSQFTFAIWNGGNPPNDTLRNFDGQIAQAAFFTNALSAGQIQQLYSAAGVPPSIYKEPIASVTANAGQNVTVATTARGSATLAYQWYQTNGTGVAGQTNASLVFNPAGTNDNGSFYLVVTNAYGAATSTIVQITIFGPPVVTAQSLTNLRVFAGTTPTLQVAVVGSSPFYYQWKLGGANITGATNSAYVDTNTTSLGTSTYSCAITNAAGSNSIAPISVTVLADPSAPYPLAVLADHASSYWRLDEPDDGIGDGNNGLPAYDYAGGYNATYSNVDLGLAGYTANNVPNTDPTETCAQFGNHTGPDGLIDDNYAGNVPMLLNFATPGGQNAEFSVEAWVNAFGQTSDAGIVAIGYGFGGEQFCLDTGADTVNTPHSLRFYVNDASGATHTAASTFAPNDGRWHHVVGVCDEANGKVSLYIDGLLAGSGLVSANAGLKGLTAPLSIGSRLFNGSSTTYSNQFLGKIDDVALYNYALSSTQVVNHYVASGVGPVITGLTPSSAVSTNQGANPTFAALVVGTPPLSYVWTDNNNNVIPWATTSSITLTNVQQSQQGNYTVTVTNLYGTASTNLFLTILTGPPQITTDLEPTNETVYAGTPISFTVSASGTLPLFYQWYQDGAKVTGATNSSYAFNALLGTNTYYVVVSNVQPPVAVSSTGVVVGITRPVLNPADYTYSMKITFPGYNRGETLLNFPALVRLGTNLAGFSFAQFASGSGGDLRFTDASGTNQIPHEIDEWNDNGISSVWVQVPSLTSNAVIWAYWGNPGATTPLAWSTNGGVWVPPAFEGLPAYEVVYHLKEGAFPFEDSTLNATSTNGVAPAATPGIVGMGGAFTGTSWLDAGTNNVGNVFTLSAWVNISSAAADIETLWCNQVGGYGQNGFGLWVDDYTTGNGTLNFASGDKPVGSNGNDTETGPGAVSFATWHLIEAAINRTNGTSSLYLDGTDVLDASAVVKDFGTLADLRLGIFDDGNFGMHGTMDEARIRQGTNSANWVWADYMTVTANSSFENYAAISNSSVSLSYQVLNGHLVLTWPTGTLQSATQVDGTYTTVGGATSPYTNSITSGQKYFRVLVGPR